MEKEEKIQSPIYFANIQTLSNGRKGYWRGLHTHNSIAEAFQAWIDDAHIFKIMFSQVINEEEPPPLENDVWQTQYIYIKEQVYNRPPAVRTRLRELNSVCAIAADEDIFWVRHKNYPIPRHYNIEQCALNIVEVLTEDEFEAKYC